MNNKNLMSNCNPSVKKYSLNKTKGLIKSTMLKLRTLVPRHLKSKKINPNWKKIFTAYNDKG